MDRGCEYCFLSNKNAADDTRNRSIETTRTSSAHDCTTTAEILFLLLLNVIDVLIVILLRWKSWMGTPDHTQLTIIIIWDDVKDSVLFVFVWRGFSIMFEKISFWWRRKIEKVLRLSAGLKTLEWNESNRMNRVIKRIVLRSSVVPESDKLERINYEYSTLRTTLLYQSPLTGSILLYW